MHAGDFQCRLLLLLCRAMCTPWRCFALHGQLALNNIELHDARPLQIQKWAQAIDWSESCTRRSNSAPALGRVRMNCGMQLEAAKARVGKCHFFEICCVYITWRSGLFSSFFWEQGFNKSVKVLEPSKSSSSSEIGGFCWFTRSYSSKHASIFWVFLYYMLNQCRKNQNVWRPTRALSCILGCRFGPKTFGKSF
jgi:hypothetical protein